jgi:hypothetical protein
MSTDKQKYSIQNQKEAIAAYAARHDLAIVGTYEDAGRSGLRIDGRQGLASFCRETPAFLFGRVSYPIKTGQTDGGSRHSPGYFDAIFDAISRSAGQDHAVLR